MDTGRLSSLRGMKKRTQQEVADYLGITRPAYTAYESGNRNPDHSTLEKLADYFEVSVDYLLGRSEGQINNNLIELSSFLSQEQKVALDDLNWSEIIGVLNELNLDIKDPKTLELLKKAIQVIKVAQDKK